MIWTTGDRVWPRDEWERGASFEVGTIERVSPAGYIRVRWDDFQYEWFAPRTNMLILVAGDDALPRHNWDVGTLKHPNNDPPCRECGERQTDQNDRGPCRQRAVLR